MNQYIDNIVHKPLLLVAGLLMGKGLDKRFPGLVKLYKRMFATSGNELIQVAIPLNKKLWVKANDPGLGLMLRTKGSFEPVQTKWWIENVKQGMKVVEIGANVGYYSVLAEAMTDKVVAIEPEQEMFALLKKNIKSQAYNVALGNKEGWVSLVTDDNPGETRVELKTGKVKMTTFAKLVKTADLVGLDVEGAEPLVLAGVKPGSVNTLVCECNSNALAAFGFTVKDLLKSVAQCGLRIESIIDENARELVSFETKELLKRLAKSSYVSLIARAQ